MENLNPDNKRRRNYSLDLLKFIASFFVVCIHFKFFGKAGEYVTVAARFAVPMFFMISGYYCFNDDLDKIRKKVIRIARIYLTAFVMYFCFNVLVKLFNGLQEEAVWYVSTYFRIRYTLKTILFNESITAIHLWFLGSLIYSYGVRCLVVKTKINVNIIYVLSCVLLATHLSLGIGLSVIGIETPTFLLKNYMLRNFLFMGFPMFAMGQLIREKEDAILKLMSGKIVALLIVLSIIDTAIVCRIDWTKEIYVGSILMAFALVVIALKMKNKEYSPMMIELFGTHVIVYVIHVMLGDILSMTQLEKVQIYVHLKPIIIFAISVVITLLINKLRFRKIQQKKDL